MTAGLGDGRFGPIYIGLDPQSDRVVVIRTFTQAMTDDQRRTLVSALQRLCDSPLEHASIAESLACGVEGDVVYLAHDYLPGSSVDEYLQAYGPRPLAEVARRVKKLAAAVDAAAVAGVYHGALGPRDILFGPESTGVSGFGLTRAAHEAGIEANPPSLADDVYAIGAMTFEMLLGYRYNGGDLRELLSELAADGVDMDTLVGALSSALTPDPGDWPPTAMQFATALQSAVIPTTTPRRIGGGAKSEDIGRLAFESLDVGAPTEVAPPPSRPKPDALPPRPVEFADDMERPELPLFDLSLHEAPDTSHIPEEPTMRHTVAAPAFGAMHAESRHARPRSRGMLIAAVVTLLAAAALVAVFFVINRPGGLDGQVAGADPTAQPPVASGGADVPGSATGASPDAAAGPEVTRLDDPADTGARPSPPAAPRASGTEPSGTASSGPASSGSASSGSASSRTGLSGTAPPETPSRTPAPTPQPSTPPSTPSAAPRAGGVSRTPPPTVPEASPEPAPRAGRAVPPPADSVRRGDEPQRQSTVPPPVADGAAQGVQAQGPQGRVLIRSTPSGARVLVDGEPRGETPVAVRGLELGAHTITVTAPGYPTWEQRVVLTTDRPSHSFEISLDAGAAAPAARPDVLNAAASLQIESRPAGAQVWMDGSLVGTTPFAVPRVGTGRHMVRIELDGFRPWTTSVAVGQGEQVRVAASLER